MSSKTPTKRQRDLMRLHRTNRPAYPKAEVMKRLCISRDYHAFNALYYSCDMADRMEKLREEEEH